MKRKIERLDVNKPVIKQLENILTRFLQVEDLGVESLLTLIGLSNERFQRIISYLRIAYPYSLFDSSSSWVKNTFERGNSEWKTNKIKERLKRDVEFARDITNIFLGQNKID